MRRLLAAALLLAVLAVPAASYQYVTVNSQPQVWPSARATVSTDANSMSAAFQQAMVNAEKRKGSIAPMSNPMNTFGSVKEIPLVRFTDTE